MSRDRKAMMRSLLAGEGAEPAPPPSPAAEKVARARAGAVGALGASLAKLAEQADVAAELDKRLKRGQAVVDLDPALVTGSFVRDRLSLEDDPAFAALKDSIAASGQQVPILVRPDPARPGGYQVAYGHRRLEAARVLGTKVRAIIRPLDDTAHVLAQGQENSARADLTYIERARFAATLEARGFTRDVIGAALSVDKTELSRLVSLAAGIPEPIALAIGPAPKIGRPRWGQLAAVLAEKGARDRAKALIQMADFQRLDSDARFEALRAALAAPPSVAADQVFRDAEGRTLARVTRGRDGALIVRLAPGTAALERVLLQALERRSVEGGR